MSPLSRAKPPIVIVLHRLSISRPQAYNRTYLFVSRYRLKAALSALDCKPGLRIVKIPAGVIVDVVGSVERSGLVDVLTDGQTLSVFMRDLEENGQRVESAKA